MHTISSTRSGDGPFVRTALFAWAFFELLAAFAVYVLLFLVAWQERVRERRALAALDDRLLRDIGISRADAEQELSKAFWEL